MEEMRQLVRAMQRELTGSDAEAVPYLIRDITSESPEGERAAGRLKEMLPKLGKASYDLAVKVIGDVASSAAKKILGM